MKVSRLRRESLKDAVIRLIEEALLNGDLRPGDRIVEANLAQQAGISRGPVREAIRQLVGEGVLVSYPSKGTFVVQWSRRAVEEAYSLRAVLEQFAIREAIKRITPEEIARLEVTVGEMEGAARRGDIRALIRLDIRFHEQLYAFSGHSLLQGMLSQLRRRHYCLLAMDQGFAVHLNEIASDHRLIVDALRSGDAVRASEAIAAHVLSAGAEVAEQVGGLSDT